MTLVVLGLGTNLGDRKQNILAAVAQLTFLKNIKQSSFYASQALLPGHAPVEWDIEFLNIAISGETHLDPFQILALIKNIERSMGRPKAYERWSPRIIDIDILLYGKHKINTPHLIIPHPELFNRTFTLQPTLEIEPELLTELI